MTTTIFKNVVGNQSSIDGESHFQSSRSKLSPQKTLGGQDDFDIIFQNEDGAKAYTNNNDNNEDHEDDMIDEADAKTIKKNLDHRAFNNLKEDLARQQAEREAQEQTYRQIKQEIKQLDGQITEEATKKDELQIVVEDLHRQIKELMEEFERAQK